MPGSRGSTDEALVESEEVSDEALETTPARYAKAIVEVKGTKITIGTLNWHFTPTVGIIHRGLLPPLHRDLPIPWLRRRVSSIRVGQGHRDHGSAAPAASPRTPAPQTYPVPASRSSGPCCPRPISPSGTLAVLPRHPRHPPAVAPGARPAQVATVAITARTWPAADER